MQFLVDFTLPLNLDQNFVDLIPAQRTRVNECFADGQISSYSLSLEHAKLWAVVNAKQLSDVQTIIDSFPLSKYMEYKIFPLTFHQTLENMVMSFSLN